MGDSKTMTNDHSPNTTTLAGSGPGPRQIAGIALCRAIVPAWVLTGAVVKLNAADPKLLPRNIWETALKLGLNDLYWLLAVLVAIEIALVGIMVLLPKLARPTAIFILSVFCLVLIGEMAAGNEKCGCFGAVSPPPWLMLLLDGALLVGCIAFSPLRRRNAPFLPSGPVTIAVLWTLAGIGVSFVNIIPESVAPAQEPAGEPPVTADSSDQSADEDAPTAPPETAPPQQSQQQQRDSTRPQTYVSRTADWQGKRFEELDFVPWVDGWPDGINQGQHYVILYSPSCDHCQELINVFFYDPPAATTIVAIPERKSGFDTDAALPMDCAGCTELELPTGTLYMITPPLVIALSDGVIQCAVEPEDTFEPECLIWHDNLAP